MNKVTVKDILDLIDAKRDMVRIWLTDEAVEACWKMEGPKND